MNEYRGICRLIQIEAKDIKEWDWIIFKRNNWIYRVERTKSDGEFLIKHINDKSEWRYIQPDDESRQDWDKFQKIVMEAIEDGEKKFYPIYFSEWQVILNCLLDKEVSFKLKYDFDYNPYAIITKI